MPTKPIGLELKSVQAAKEKFPTGLSQPKSGFRFSVDSLLLACFAPLKGVKHVLDMGTGCGVVGLAYLLRAHGRATVTAIDIDPDMIVCAQDNAARLGLTQVFTSVLADASITGPERSVPPESHDLVLINPPFRQPGKGRLSSTLAKNQARFESENGLSPFLKAAGFALANKGQLCMIHLAERLDELLAALPLHRLTPKRLRCVHGRANDPAKLVLIEARKNGRPGLIIEPPLILYTLDRNQNRPSRQATAFCPFIKKNSLLRAV